MCRNMLFFLVMGIGTLAIQAQDQAYYLKQTNGHAKDADLFRVQYENGWGILDQAYAFQDSIYSLPKSKRLSSMPIHFACPPPDTTKRLGEDKELQFFFNQGYTSSFQDSIQVNGQWHHINICESDDGFIGGRPNQVNRRVHVPTLGVVYSYSNYMAAHSLFMLCHSNLEKQTVLEAVYQYLSEKNTWLFWSKNLELSKKYPFNSCLETLSVEWLAIAPMVQVIDWSAKSENGKIHYSATIKNLSDKGVLISDYTNFAPSDAFIYYENRDSVYWNLVESHYGRHFHTIRSKIYLAAGNTHTFTHDFHRNYGCGSCTNVKYGGLQLYSRKTLYQYLIEPTTIYGNKEYTIYPHRRVPVWKGFKD